MAIAHLGDLNGGKLAAAGEVGELWWQIAYLGDLNGGKLAAAGEVGELWWQIAYLGDLNGGKVAVNSEMGPVVENSSPWRSQRRRACGCL